MQERGLFDTIIGSFRQRLSSLPDKRTGKNTRHGMEDAAFLCYFEIKLLLTNISTLVKAIFRLR
ncbi:hypothetical protein [Oscillatoria salina]|uniref:hypothetical protein n=1 Tax=Oscillatoria salina TaxID=331517 RepID=UPI001CCE88FC|nr:hypothetical protein [Oscillatoria salina]MBZ8181478.1 hypothetical protein [Oscillatoria salina IIICB1]